METQAYFAEIKTATGEVVGTLTLPAKNFKTGSRGFYGMGKLEVDGKRYQMQIQMVEIGSKAAAGGEA